MHNLGSHYVFLNTESAGKPIMSPTQRRQTAQDLRLIRDSVKHKKLKVEGFINLHSRHEAQFHGHFDQPCGLSWGIWSVEKPLEDKFFIYQRSIWYKRIPVWSFLRIFNLVSYLQYMCMYRLNFTLWSIIALFHCFSIILSVEIINVRPVVNVRLVVKFVDFYWLKLKGIKI